MINKNILYTKYHKYIQCTVMCERFTIQNSNNLKIVKYCTKISCWFVDNKNIKQCRLVQMTQRKETQNIVKVARYNNIYVQEIVVFSSPKIHNIENTQSKNVLNKTFTVKSIQSSACLTVFPRSLGGRAPLILQCEVWST